MKFSSHLLWGRKLGDRLTLAMTLLLWGSVALADDEVGMFLDLKINQMQRGEFATYRTTDGDFLVRLADFPELGLKRDINQPRVRIAGESGSFVSLRDLGASSLLLDSAKMSLDVELPPSLFDKTTIDTATPDTRKTLAAENKSGFINYRLSEYSYGATTAKHALATELGLRYGDVLLLNQSQLQESGEVARYLTQMVYDLPQEQQRFVLGDFTAFSGELGSVLPMGGLSLSKLYSMSPELVRQPLASFAGVATSPSQVEVRVGGVPIAYSQVSAGPFELQNLRQYGGANDVQVVVRDALGREQVYGFPYYYADQSLRQGLHEYSYALGKLRVHPGQPGDDYRDTALSAFHRFGYSDQLTFGGRAEAAQDLSNLGLEAAWRSNQWGVLSAAVSAGNYRGQSGDAAMLSYSYRQPAFSFNSIARRYSEHYAPLETLVNGFHRSGEYGATFAWYPNAGNSFNLSHTLTQSRDQGDSRVTSLSGSHRLGPASLLYATLQRTDDAFGSSPNNSLFIGWLYRFGGKYTASASASGDEHGQQTLFTQLSKDIPYGEGLGYRVGWTGTKPQNDDRFNGYAQWNLPAVSLSVDMNTLPAQNGNADYRELAATGSIAYAGNAWGLTRQINDSFAVVQMGAPVSGVRVMSNSQEIGFSDSKGQVISPFLGSFYESSISVDEQTIPLQYVMGKSIYTVKPTYRSGVGVNFGLRSVHGLDGVIRLRTATGTATADNWLVTLTHDGNLEQDFQIGRDGRFYLENIAPGDYQGEIPTTPNACRFTLQVPVTQEIVFTLPGDLICEPIP